MDRRTRARADRDERARRREDERHERRRASRTRRYQLLRALWQESSLDRVRDCQRVAAPSTTGAPAEVTVKRREGVASFSGLKRCDSIHACPVCSTRVRGEYAAEIQDAATRWAAAGGGLVMVTLTMRHRQGERLADLWDDLAEAWRGMHQGKWARWERERYGIAGYVRATETTHGANGWHPHLHVLVFTGSPLSEADLHQWLYGARERERGPSGRWRTITPDGWWLRWRHRLVARGQQAPIRDYGIDHQRIVSAEGVSQYLAKVGDGVDERYYFAGDELARADAKIARRGSRTPLAILDDAVEHRSAADWRLWWEWEQASHGHRVVEWSRDLRGRVACAPSVQPVEPVDETTDEVLWTFGGYDRLLMVEDGAHAQVLNAAEIAGTRGIVAVLLGLAWRGETDRPDPGRSCPQCEGYARLCIPHEHELMWRRVEAHGGLPV